ncbi:MAG: hypothetical protein OXI63_06295 [Candidatus Poribacteria bacterium]|nr:hypothetical protein [Candidatus Poribacteria bacterium]
MFISLSTHVCVGRPPDASMCRVRCEVEFNLMGVLPKRNKKEKEGAGNPFQEGTGLYSNTENVQSAMIETSTVIPVLRQCYVSRVLTTPVTHPEKGSAALTRSTLFRASETSAEIQRHTYNKKNTLFVKHFLKNRELNDAARK